MNTKLSHFVVPFAVLVTISLGNAFAAPVQHGKWIDLTHPFSEKTLYWPTAKSFTLEQEFHAHTEKG
jgi:hypothetical protein